ncbi:MAG: ABC transporter permease [Candidatus Thorarchaeota archaeon]
MENNIGGIFYPIIRFLRTRLEIGQRSRQWRAVFVTIAAVVVLLMVGLFLVAMRSHSGIGVPVVIITFIGAFGIALLEPVRRNLMTRRLSKREGYIAQIGMTTAIYAALFGLSWGLRPTEAVDLSVATMVGSTALGAILIVFYEGYPRLSVRGMPGYLTLSGLAITLSIVYMTAISTYIVPYNPFTLNVGPVRSPPSLSFPMGTTSLGQDLLSRTIAGGATMLQVAVLSVAICFAVGVPLGLAASYRGGLVDRTVALVMDSIFALPGLVLAIAVAAILGRGVVNMALAISVVYIPSYFRVIRSQVLTVKELPYVEAAVVLGARNRDVLLRYILPNVLPSSVVVMSMNFADAILTAAGLTFIGLGMGIDVADWGWDLTAGSKDLLVVGAWWIITFPGIMIVILALGFALIGEGVNEILTPRLRE